MGDEGEREEGVDVEMVGDCELYFDGEERPVGRRGGNDDDHGWGMSLVVRGEAVTSFMWGRSDDGGPTSTGGMSGSVCICICKFHGKVPCLRSYRQILIDVYFSYHTHRHLSIVASTSRSLSSQLLVHRVQPRDLYGSLPLPFSFRTSHPRHHPH